MPKHLTQALKLLLPILIALLTGESFCRALGLAAPNPYFGTDKELFVPVDTPGLGFGMAPHLDAEVYLQPVHLNAHGLRSPEILSDEPLGDTKRVLCLGDSVGFGYGVPEAEVYARVLQDRLENVETINAGVPGYNTRQEVNWFREIGLGLHPDVVVLLYVFNDPEAVRPITPEGVILPVPEDIWAREAARPPTLLQALGRRSRLAAFLDSTLMPLLPSGRNRTQRVAKYFNQEIFENPGWEDCRAALHELATLCEERGIPVLAAIHPILAPWNAYPFGAHEKRVKDVCLDLGFATLTVRPVYAAYPFRRIQLHPADGHPSALGHKILGEALAEHVRLLLETKQDEEIL